MENKQDKGFTLVELLIVIVILGILATVTVFAVRGITNQGKASACNSDQKTLQTAVEAYFAQNGGSTIAIGTDTVPGPAAAGATAEDTLVLRGLLVAPSGNYVVAPAGTLTYQTANCGGDIGDPVPAGQAMVNP